MKVYAPSCSHFWVHCTTEHSFATQTRKITEVTENKQRFTADLRLWRNLLYHIATLEWLSYACKLEYAHAVLCSHYCVLNSFAVICCCSTKALLQCHKVSPDSSTLIIHVYHSSSNTCTVNLLLSVIKLICTVELKTNKDLTCYGGKLNQKFDSGSTRWWIQQLPVWYLSYSSQLQVGAPVINLWNKCQGDVLLANKLLSFFPMETVRTNHDSTATPYTGASLTSWC